MQKKTTFSVLLLLFCTTLLTAQVGIGTTSPADGAILDISSSDSGIIIPRVALTATNVVAPIVSIAPTPENGLMVFNTNTAGTAPNNVTPGFYYWSDGAWVRIASGASTGWALTGNAGTDPNTNFIGTTDNVDFRVRTNNAQRFNFTSNGRLRAYVDGSATEPAYSWSGANGQSMGMYRIGANILGFSTSSTERMRINAAGRIGINSTNPLGFVHVRSPLTGPSPGGGPGIYSEITVTNSNWSAIEVFNPNISNGSGLTATGVFGVRGQGVFAVEGIGFLEGVYGQGFDGVFGVTTDLIDGWAGYFIGDVGVDGDIIADDYFIWSDMRVKSNLRDIRNALNIIEKLNPITYDKSVQINRENNSKGTTETITPSKERINSKKSKNSKREFGLLAQEVELILPELVKEKKMNIEGLGEIDLKSVNYLGLIPILIQGIQEQQEIIDSQEKRIAKLEALVNELINK